MLPNWASGPQNQPRAKVAVSISPVAEAEPSKCLCSTLVWISVELFIIAPCFIGCSPSSAGGLKGHSVLPRRNAASAAQMTLPLGAKTNPVSLFGKEVTCVLSVRPEALPVFHMQTECLITAACPACLMVTTWSEEILKKESRYGKELVDQDEIACVGSLAGRLNQNTVLPGALCAPVFPPWASRISFTMASPIPVPPKSLERDFSPR